MSPFPPNDPLPHYCPLLFTVIALQGRHMHLSLTSFTPPPLPHALCIYVEGGGRAGGPRNAAFICLREGLWANGGDLLGC